MNSLALIYVFSLVAIGLQVARHPFLLMRPSLWVSIPFMLCIGGAAAFTGPEIELGYHNAFKLRLLALVFPLVILGWVVVTPGLSMVSRRIYLQSKVEATEQSQVETRTVTIAIGLVATIILLVYLSMVPLRSTGLWAIINDPASATLAREESLKLLSSVSLAYAFTMYQKILAPLLVALLVLWKIPRFSLLNVFRLVLILAVFISVMLPGARSPAGLLILVLALVVVLKSGVARGVLSMVSAVLGGLTVASVMTLMRQGQVIMLANGTIWGIIGNSIFMRAFVTPFKTGLWTNLYAQSHGLTGISSIRPLALLFGVPYVKLSNQVALAYSPTGTSTSYANTSFLFSLQSAFGLEIGWCAALVLLCSLDFLLFAFLKLRGELLVAFMCALLISLTSLIYTGFSPCLGTHGVLPITLGAFFIGRFMVGPLRLRR